MKITDLLSLILLMTLIAIFCVFVFGDTEAVIVAQGAC